MGGIDSCADAGTLDWVTAISTALAALGTLAAVIVTLYFNVWRSRARQPKLTMDFIDDVAGVTWLPGHRQESDSHALPMIVRNQRGRTTAHDVEVLVDLAIEMDDGSWHDYFIQQPLVWASIRRQGGMGTTRAEIPPGASRRFFTAFLGEPSAVYEEFWPYDKKEIADQESGVELDEQGKPLEGVMPIAGAVAFFPLDQKNIEWIYRERKYRWRFMLTAQDVDGVVYEAFLTFRMPPRDGGELWLVPEWTDLQSIETEAN